MLLEETVGRSVTPLMVLISYLREAGTSRRSRFWSLGSYWEVLRTEFFKAG